MNKLICKIFGHRVRTSKLPSIYRLPAVIVEECIICDKRISVKNLDGTNYL